MEEDKKDLKISKKRDISIDLIRIIACIIVIGTHLTLTTYNIYEVQVDWSRLFTKCFLADGVGIFFLITGFFISNGRNYKKILKNTFDKIVIPSFILLVFSQVFYKYLINQESFIYCIRNVGMSNVKTIMSAILHGEVHQTIPIAAHLWYIFAYIQIIILFPVLRLLCKENEESKLARRIVIILSILSIVLKDVQKLIVLPIENIEVFTLIDAKLLFVLLGYELYCAKDKIKNNKVCFVVGTVLFFIINILRYKAEMKYMIINHLVKEEAFVKWDTIFGIISSVSLFLAVYSIDIKNLVLSKIITYLSSMTFGIYLIHFLIIAKIDIFKFEKISTVKFELLYMFVGILTIFIMSLIITIVIKKIIEYTKCFIEFMKKIGKTEIQ